MLILLVLLLRFFYNQWIIKGEDNLFKEADGEIVNWKLLTNESLKIAARRKSYRNEIDGNNALLQDDTNEVTTVNENEIVNINIEKLRNAIDRILQLSISVTQV